MIPEPKSIFLGLRFKNGNSFTKFNDFTSAGQLIGLNLLNWTGIAKTNQTHITTLAKSKHNCLG